MLKITLLLSALLTTSGAFSADTPPREIIGHVSVSGIATTLDTLEVRIAQLAKDNNATDWKITSMRINNNGFATAVLYK